MNIFGIKTSWLPYSTYLYLDFHLCSMTKLKEHDREICYIKTAVRTYFEALHICWKMQPKTKVNEKVFCYLISADSRFWPRLIWRGGGPCWHSGTWDFFNLFFSFIGCSVFTTEEIDLERRRSLLAFRVLGNTCTLEEHFFIWGFSEPAQLHFFCFFYVGHWRNWGDTRWFFIAPPRPPPA